MDLSIVIVSWNTCDLLRGCLASIYSHMANTEPVLFEIFVVDNASTDGSAEMVRERFPGVHLIVNGANVGFARASNQALRLCHGRYVLLLNSDTVVLPNAIAALMRFMSAHEAVGLLGGNLLNADRSPQACYGNTPCLLSELLALLSLDRRLPLPDALQCSLPRWAEPPEGFREVGWVLGACMMTRRAALDNVGLLDEGYFMFSEETDWARRAKRSGWRVAYLASAGIVHYGGASTRQVRYHMLPYLYASKARYLRVHDGHMPAACFRLAVLGLATGKGTIAALGQLFGHRGGPTLRDWLRIAGEAWRLSSC